MDLPETELLDALADDVTPDADEAGHVWSLPLQEAYLPTLMPPGPAQRFCFGGPIALFAATLAR